VETLAKKSVEKENTIIGHIKGFTKLAEDSFIQVSTVSANHPATSTMQDSIKSTYKCLSITLNFLVYGLPFTDAQSIAEKSAKKIALENDGKVRFSMVSDPNNVSHHHSHHSPGAPQ